MISINNVSVVFTGNELFKNISFVINNKDRIGLVGKNGAGKSTLLKLIAGEFQPDQGKIVVNEGKTIGYLPQEIKIDSDKSVYEETLTVFEEAKKIEDRIAFITKELEIRTDYESDSYTDIITELTELHEQFNIVGGNQMESEVGKILKGLGFKTEDFDRLITDLSGGWQMRVELAKLLLMMPSLLLLDEPTNHLDIESIMWLEDFFKNYPGAIMMVSHDRMFLDNITNRTIEIVYGKTYDYKVPYTKYFELRAERLAHQEAAYKNQQKYISEQEDFINRFKAKASKAKQAQSKMKQLEKIERIEFDTLDNSTIQFHFPPAPRSGDLVVEGISVKKDFENKKVLGGIDFKIERGEKIAFVGQNGMGKSTLVKMIHNEFPQDSGEINLGYNVAIGYYAQVQESTLNANLSVLETIENEATGENAKIHKVRGLLGSFLFSNEDVDKKVKVLSGGEKSRLALAKLLLNPVNLLILDEPTNHLDMASKNVLKTALQKFDGTLIVVSHDRDFLADLTDKTFEFKNHQIKEHIGGIEEFLGHHEIETFREFEQTNDKKSTKKNKSNSDSKKQFEQSKEQEKALKKLQKNIANVEGQISKYETKIADFEKLLNNSENYQDIINDTEKMKEYESLKKSLDTEMQHWEDLSEQVEQME